VNRSDAVQQIRALKEQAALLRPMQVDNPTYKLWLGDIVELVQAVWGSDAPQLEEIVAALREHPTLPKEEGATLRYIARLDRLHRVLMECERDLTPTD
jgi:hypothetical protein